LAPQLALLFLAQLKDHRVLRFYLSSKVSWSRDVGCCVAFQKGFNHGNNSCFLELSVAIPLTQVDVAEDGMLHACICLIAHSHGWSWGLQQDVTIPYHFSIGVSFDINSKDL
jgi:hypothetical protein